ncbi:MAG: hypothetical protein ABI435_07410 [Pseudolysinimonas sp.]
MNRETRDEALRRVLVAGVDAGPSPRSRRTFWVAVVGAFVLGAALTGSALAVAGSHLEVGTDLAQMATPPFINDDVRILSEPYFLTGTSAGSVDVGSPPPGADALAISLHCVEPGTYGVLVDGDERTRGTTSCFDGQIGGGGWYQGISGSASHRVDVTASTGSYALWVAWVDLPPVVQVSAAQQAALADGVVTREEYLAGFDRYAACLAEAGYVVGANRSDLILGYSVSDAAVRSGVEGRCYVAEFGQLDMRWQIAQEG